MKHKIISLICLTFLSLSSLLFTASLSFANSKNTNEPSKTAPGFYGKNTSAGQYRMINGIKMYYEIYGEGEPLLLIHGNDGSIQDMKFQIEYFSKYYQVIVADSRGHGKSDKGKQQLNYPLMASDWAHLLDSLDIKSAHVFGWSDGGIIGLLLAINHPQKVRKVAVMGANLQPDESAVYPWAVNWVKDNIAYAEEKIAAKDKSKDWELIRQKLRLLGTQPNISLDDLHKISAPVLVLAGDRDIIREEHTIKMYQNIAKSHLAIFPGETHWAPINQPELFNVTVHKFLSTAYSRPESRDVFYPKEAVVK